MKVQWGSCLSRGFSVSNGVRQGGVLSPYLFAVYLDGLLEELSNSGVGCYCFCFCLWVLWPMLMILCCWHLVPQH